MTDRELVEACDRADQAYLVEMTRRTPGGEVREQDGLLLAIGVDPSPVVVNSILPIEPAVDPASITDAVAVFTRIGHQVAIWTRDHVDAYLEPALSRIGFAAVLRLP